MMTNIERNRVNLNQAILIKKSLSFSQSKTNQWLKCKALNKRYTSISCSLNEGYKIVNRICDFMKILHKDLKDENSQTIPVKFTLLLQDRDHRMDNGKQGHVQT